MQCCNLWRFDDVLSSLQVGIFSATLPPDALDITRKFMNKPVRLAKLFCSTIMLTM